MLSEGDRLGDWVVEHALGAGGMGAVFLCHNAHSRRIKAAVKVMNPSAEAGGADRFLREIEALDALRHPAVVQLKGWGRDEARDLWFLAMEVVDGEPLGAVLDRGPMPVPAALRVFEDIAAGLGHAHDRGLAHRDIKPGNIMVTPSGGAVVIDFGIVKGGGSATKLTKTGMVPGTIAYIAPEALAGGTPDPKAADVYALGLMLHEVLTGTRAFPEDVTLSAGEQMARTLSAKLAAEPFDPGPLVPRFLRDLVRDATAPRPEDRPTVAELGRRLSPEAAPPPAERVQANTGPTVVPAVANAPPRRRRVWSVLAGAAGLVLGMLGVGAAVGVVVGAIMLWPPSAPPQDDTGTAVVDTDPVEEEPPDPMEVLRGTVEALRADRDAPEGAAAAVAALLPDRTAEVTGFVLLRADRPAAQVNADVLALADGAVALLDGRYVLAKSLEITNKRDVALIAMPDTEVFVRTGQAVISIAGSQGVTLHGLYLNHHATETPYYTWGECVELNPALRRSHVVLVSDSTVAMHGVELEGSGFIGVEARNSEITITSSIIHDTVAEAVLLKGESTGRIDQLLAHDVGARAFYPVIDAEYEEGCNGPFLNVATFDNPGWGSARVRQCPGWNPTYTFRTAFTVDKGSSLEITGLTLYNPEPREPAEAFSVAGRLTLRDAILAGGGSALEVRPGGAIEVTDLCTQAPAAPTGVSLSGSLQVAWSPDFDAPGDDTFVATVPADDRCAALGAELEAPVIRTRVPLK